LEPNLMKLKIRMKYGTTLWHELRYWGYA